MYLDAYLFFFSIYSDEFECFLVVISIKYTKYGTK